MIEYTQLGATLFVPASFPSLDAIVNEQKYPELKSLVIDFEDGLATSRFAEAMQNIEEVLKDIDGDSPLVFLRAKNVEHLESLLELESISKVHGFILAKFSLETADRYLASLQSSDFLVMPSIEGKELFNHEELHRLKEKILAYKQRVIVVRIGIEDMLRQLGMRRKKGESVFEFAATAHVIGNFIATFKSTGFAISGGVYPFFQDEEGFRDDVKRDLKEGLFSKTIIHPSQIETAHECYRVSSEELAKAEATLLREEEAVFAYKGSMVEVATMTPYAKEILQRATLYGLSD